MQPVFFPEMMRASVRFHADGRPVDRNDAALRRFRQAEKEAARQGRALRLPWRGLAGLFPKRRAGV